MSSQHNGNEIKKPVPRRLFSRAPSDDSTQTAWLDSREALTSSPAGDAPPATHRELRKALPFLSSSSSSRSASPEPSGSRARARWNSVRQHVLLPARQRGSSGSRSGTPTPAPTPPDSAYPQYQHYHQPSSASSTTSFPQRPLSRSQTPKPGSRLAARLGFRHVVDHAREVAVDENRKLADDVFRACWAARVGVHTRSSSSSTVGGGKGKYGDTLNTVLTGASNIHLPFSNNTASTPSGGLYASFSGATSGSGVGLHSKKSPSSPYGFGGAFNPSSTSSFNVSATLASASASAYNLINSASHTQPSTQHHTPSIKHLHQVLWQASGSSSVSLRSVYLPHESLVLSALLVPFLGGGSGNGNTTDAGKVEEERWLAVDAFELMVKTWPPANELASAERCLWCTKAATPLPASPLRSRVLSALWGLTNPNENTHVFLSPDTIHSIACGVFLLFPLISSPSPTSPTSSSLQYPHATQTSSKTGDSPDEDILHEVLSHLSTGVLDEEACEDEYGKTRVKWNAREDDADIIRRMMLSESLAKCLTVAWASGSVEDHGRGSVARLMVVGGRLIGRSMDDYWAILKERPTQLQITISVRRIMHWCNGVVSFLSQSPHLFTQAPAFAHSTSPMSDPSSTPTPIIQRIVSLLESVIMPEIHILSSSSSPSAEGKIREARMSVARVILELFCVYPSTGGAGGDETNNFVPLGNVNQDPTTWAGDLMIRWFTVDVVSGWKESFEEMLKDFVTNAEWGSVVERLMSFVTRMCSPGDGVGVRKMVIGGLFSCLTDRLIQDPPPAYLLALPLNHTQNDLGVNTHNQSAHSRSSSSYTYTSSLYAPSHSTATTTLPELLQLISEVLPQTLFKPLFSLATSLSSTSTSIYTSSSVGHNTESIGGIGAGTIALANTLCVVYALSAVVRDWWLRDAEMICIAVMSDVGSGGGDRKGKGKAGDTGGESTGAGRTGPSLGQMIVLFELVNKLRMVRRLRDSKAMSGGGSADAIAAILGSDAARAGLNKFVVGLELRLAILIQAKEKQHPLPPTQRLLLLMLFRELRLLTRSLKPASWISNTIIQWFEEYLQDEDEQAEEVQGTLREMKELYEFAKGAVGNSNRRRTVVIIPTTTDKTSSTTSPEETLSITVMLDNSLKHLSSIAEGGFIPRAVKLLVTVSAILSLSDWNRIAPLVWYRGLLIDENVPREGGNRGVSEDQKPRAVTPLVCFLIMQCAEKNSRDFRAMVEVDMRSSDDLTRLESVHKLGLLVGWRFQIMSESHNILVDRAHRPFRLARAPLPFVPTDMGSPNYVHNTVNDVSATPFVSPGVASSQDSSSNTPKSRKGKLKKDAIPIELKRQLVEIGWVDDDDEDDEKELWIRTPVSLLPVNHVERLDLQRSSEHHRGRQYSPDPTQASSPALSSPATSSGGKLTPLMGSNPSGSGGGGRVDSSGEGELLRRNSSSGGPTYAKRRPVFVPPLSLVFRVLATMVFDPSFAVASAARATLLDMMRNDPALLLRPILDLFCDDQGHGYDDSTQKDVRQAINIFTALLHTRHMIPPPMAHALFNNLAGFLKYTLRQADPSAVERGGGDVIPAAAGDSLTTFALTVPIMARLAMYVGDLTIREIRRSKMDHFLIPYGTLWFNNVGVPSAPMFPRGLTLEVDLDGREGGQYGSQGANPFESEADMGGQTAVIVGLDSRLVKVVMIRIAQNMMFVEMLKKSAQDVVLVRKTMPKFVMLRLDGSEREEDGRMLELSDFVPFTGERFKEDLGSDEHAKKTLNGLSLALARSYVTLVAQMFRCMSRNSNDREEMANFVVGLNRILLVHGDDIGIVGHVLIAFMVASARFRRLFTSGGGYALFMPALVKVYAESQQRTDIKLAIEYAVYRFYALHREAFLFQSLDAIAHIVALPETDAVQYAARVYDMFYSLRSGVSPTNLDPAGIHGINRLQEQEAFLFHAAEDQPQTFLTVIRRGEAQTNGQIFFDVPDSYESSRLRMEDFVKLFLTIIAHDPSILRAQQLMRMFRFLAPHLYNASPQARNVLQEGLEALSEILVKVFSKSKAAEAGSAVRDNEADITLVGSVAGQEPSDKSKATSNPSIMRMDFLFALVSVGQAGCHIPPQMAKQSIEIARLILKGAPSEMLEPLSVFFADLTKLVVLRGDLSKPKYVMPFVQEISPFLRAYTATLNFTSVFETITQLCSTPPYTHEPAFARLVIHEICIAGLEACELITDEAKLSRTRFRTALVSLLAEAVLLRGSDMLGELEKRNPTFHFLAKVVLPLTLALKTSSQLASRGKTETWYHRALTNSWIRLLFYAMTACQRSFRAAESLPLSRSKSREKRGGEEKQWQAHLPTFTTALQIIKVIVVRAETEISSTFPDLWQRLAVFLKSALMDGNANFAFHGPVSIPISPLPSPSPSPRGSVQVDRSERSPSFFDLPGQSTMDVSSTVPFSPPRVIDYAAWSLFEFLCAYRSPLRLQLRLFMTEKVVALDQELKHRQQRQSPFASPSMTPRSRRASTSVFAKPRRSGLSPSPDSSPRASRSPSMIHELSIPSIHLGPGMNRTTSLEIPISSSGGELRIPGYQYTSPTISPSTPKQGAASYLQVDEQGPRIVHLGPTSPSALIPPPPLSPSGGGSMGVSNIRLMGQSTQIKSSALTKATYRRIRLVQTFMGYDMLLPLPVGNVGLGITGLGMENDEVSFVTWTRRSALEAILNETKQLEEEFKETASGGLTENEDVLTEPVATSATDPTQLAI